MVFDFHERNMAKKLDRPVRDLPTDEIGKVFEQCEKNASGKVDKAEMTRWVKGFMKCQTEHDHEERLCIQKIVSSKEEKLEKYEPPKAK